MDANNVLSEMTCLSGRVLLSKAGHEVAYCAQNPCMSTDDGPDIIIDRVYAGLEHATIRDNIIFSSAKGYDEARYQAVIDACALQRDLEVFDAGDMTGAFFGGEGNSRLLRLMLTVRNRRKGHHALRRTKG